MAKYNVNLKGRKIKDKFLYIPRPVFEHKDFISLSARALKLLIDMAIQFTGYNNGDLCATIKLMKKRGWKSCDQLDKAKKELLAKNLIQITRYGGRKTPTLYALAWRHVDDCKGKLDMNSTTKSLRNFKFE